MHVFVRICVCTCTCVCVCVCVCVWCKRLLISFCVSMCVLVCALVNVCLCVFGANYAIASPAVVNARAPHCCHHTLAVSHPLVFYACMQLMPDFNSQVKYCCACPPFPSHTSLNPCAHTRARTHTHTYTYIHTHTHVHRCRMWRSAS
jgi:hypothetical protein